MYFLSSPINVRGVILLDMTTVTICG